MVDEAKLLRRLRAGDVRALEQAVTVYTPYLSTAIYRAVGGALSREDVEELLSDAFVCLWERAGGIDPEKGSLRSYLAAVARNGAYRRLRERRESVPLEEAGEVPAPPPEDLGVWDAVMSLGEPDAELFVRYYRYGQSVREIAAATGLKPGTVKSRLSRGRQKLKTILLNAEGSS